MKDLEEAKRILSMKIEKDRVNGRVSLTQKAYLQKVLQKFLISDEVKSVSSPFPSLQAFSSNVSEDCR